MYLLLFHNSDAVVSNLECPVTQRITPVNKIFIFRGEPEWLKSLKKAGITHLAMANNHTYDQGRNGLEDTYSNIIANKLISIGFGKTHEESCKPVIIKKGSLQIAIFNSVLLPLENFPFIPDKPCICQASAEDLAVAISNFKKQYPQTFVVVFLHWGVEYKPTATTFQYTEALKLIEAGADAIIGSSTCDTKDRLY